jgi:hypothetical protein
MNIGMIINSPGITQNITISRNAANITEANKGLKTYDNLEYEEGVIF